MYRLAPAVPQRSASTPASPGLLSRSDRPNQFLARRNALPEGITPRQKGECSLGPDPCCGSGYSPSAVRVEAGRLTVARSLIGSRSHTLLALRLLRGVKTRGGLPMTSTGTVKFFNADKGFGFITSSDGTELFVHVSNVVGSGVRTLTEGQAVEFSTAPGRKGQQAVDVRPV